MRRLLVTLLCLLSSVSCYAVSQPTYYTPDTMLAELERDLSPWVRSQKGVLSLARDPYHFLELLAESPAGWRAVLHWDGEANPGDDGRTGVFATQKLSLGLTKNLGLTAKPDEALVKKALANPAFLRLVALVRERVRSYVWPDEVTSRYTLYTGCDPVVLPDSGLPLAAYRLNFELSIALPPVEYRNDV